MTTAACLRFSAAELLGYWLGELEEAQERVMDEHLFECASCSGRLDEIVRLGKAVRRDLLSGGVTFVTSTPFIEAFQQAGWRVREYGLDVGGSVDCTVGRDDDFVVAYLRAPLRGVQRLDVTIDEATAGRLRLEDVPFDPEAGAIAAVTSTTYLRSLQRTRLRMQLLAVDGAQERVLGEYTFNHSPF